MKSINDLFAEPPEEVVVEHDVPQNDEKEVAVESDVPHSTFDPSDYGEEVHMPYEPPPVPEKPVKEKNKGGRPPKDQQGSYRFPNRPRLPKKRKDLTPRQWTKEFFENNLEDFAVTMWEVATDRSAKPSERQSAAKTALEFMRGKAGQEEQIRNEKPELQIHTVGGGSLKEELLGSKRLEGELPEEARERLTGMNAQSRQVDDRWAEEEAEDESDDE